MADGDGGAVSRPLTVTVAPEDAELAYTGDTLSSGSVLLRATIADADDGSPGDLTRATVTFKEGSRTLCGPLPAGDGIVSCRVRLPRGSHTVDVVAGGYYTGATSANVRVATPRHTRVSATGELTVRSSAGTYAADARSRLAFAFDVRAKHHRGIRGDAEVAYVSGGRELRISADHFTSLGASADGRRAEFRAVADVWQRAWWFWPRTIARDVTLHVTVDEARTVAISVWDENTLLFSLPEQAIKRGAISIK